MHGRKHLPAVNMRLSCIPSKESIEWEVGNKDTVEELNNSGEHKEDQEGVNGLETG